MKPETYKALLKDLQKIQKTLVASQIATARRDPALASRLERLHAEAEVGGRLDDFVATRARQSTVLFLLRTVFVRVLEDLEILTVKRIRDEWGFAAFREVAPALGRRAYFRFIFRDLAVDFPALFSPGDDELPLPDEDGCFEVWKLWHHPNKDGEHYRWDQGGFDSRFLGDLYQDLDADIRKRYALLQTPRFVEEYILDHTLTPALAEFDPAELHKVGQRFRLLDPTCGSGHFLIGAFHRLADYWRDKHGMNEWQASERALESVWGCDINPHAVEIADFRLLLEVVARTSVKSLERLAELKLNLRAMDSLIPWERGAKQGELFSAKDRLDAYATPEHRRENAAFLGREFHVVVGNPPYITPKDVRKRDDYRVFWPDSCHMEYAMSAPFAERLLSLGVAAAFSGQITANSFMKRQFGKRLIEDALPRFELSEVIDTSGAYIPGHGTPTVILIGRNRGPEMPYVRAILGKRGEPKRPADPESGLVWSAIRAAGDLPDDSSAFITVAMVERSIFGRHPWSLGGGEAGPTLGALTSSAKTRLAERIELAGFGAVTREDDVFVVPPNAERRFRIPSTSVAGFGVGEDIRDWGIADGSRVIFPYDRNGTVSGVTLGRWYEILWRFRAQLWLRQGKGFKTKAESGGAFYEYSMFYPERFFRELGLSFGFVSTHNHFVLDRGGKVFNRTAPVIKLPATATLDDHLDLLGLLNSSTLGFWMKQVFHNKGEGGGTRVESGHSAAGSEEWKNHYEYDSTKLQQAPIGSNDRNARIVLSRSLDALAQERAQCLPTALLAASRWSLQAINGDLMLAHNSYLNLTERMVALQEELDWLTYSSYGLIDPIPTVDPDHVEPLAPGHRPFEIVLARKDDEADDDEKSAWWARHGHERVTEIPERYLEPHRARIRQRIELIESDPRIALLETPPYKRRWQLADWAAETKKAAESWLLDRLEDLFAPATDNPPRGRLAEPKPYRLEDVAVAWARDPRAAAVAGVWTGTGPSVDLTLVAEKLLRSHALPDNPLRLYSEEGLRKLDEWKRVWALQDQEDAWEKLAAEAKERGEVPPKKRLVDPDDPTKELDAIPLPPKFDKNDFVRAEYFSTRGKLNVPRERFILFGELSPARYGWNGWRDRERALAQVEAFTLAESNPENPLPIPTPDDARRCGVTYGLWESLLDVRRWGAAEEHGELQSLAREACRQERCPCPIVEAWKAQVLHAKSVVALAKKPKQKAPEAPEVSIAERAWVASLLSHGSDYDMATIWTNHRTRLSEPAQGTLPGVPSKPIQIVMPEVTSQVPKELVSLDEAKLARVLDDLIASGDVQAGGRGKKKRYQLVPRGGAS